MKKLSEKQFEDFCEKNEISCGRFDINDDDFMENYYIIDNSEKMEAIKSTGIDFYYCCGYKYDCCGSETYMYCRNYDHFDPEDVAEETSVEIYRKGQIKDIKAKIKELREDRKDAKDSCDDGQVDYINDCIDIYNEAIDSVRNMKKNEVTAVSLDDRGVFNIKQKTYGFEDESNNYVYFVMAFLKKELKTA